MSQDIALGLLQLVALAIPPVAVLIQMLRRSENLAWKWRRLSFGLAILSVVSFIGTGVAVLGYFITAVAVPPMLALGFGLTVLGLVPFALFTGVLYKEHREAFGP